jgi:PAS domain S-box-containing protein
MGSDENTAAGIDLGKIVNALPAPVWTTQDDGRCDFVNRHWCEYTGIEPKVALDHGWQRAIHPDDLRPLLDAWNAIRQSGVVKEIDARLRRSDGEYRWYVFRPSLMEETPGRGRGRWCWLGSYADEGLETDGRLRRLWDVLPWQAGFLDKAGVLEFTNRQSLEDFGMTQVQLEQWTNSGIIHVDDIERNAEGSATLLTAGQLWDHEQRMLYPNGKYRWTRSRCVPVRDAQGNVVRYVTFQVDIDALKQAEGLLAAEVKVLERVARGEPLDQVLEALSHHVEELCNGCFCNILLDNSKHLESGAGRSVPDGYTSCYSIPIVSGSGAPAGVIAIYRREPHNPDAQEQDLVDRFAKIAGIAIERSRAEEALGQARLELTHVARMATLSSMTASITHEVSQPISGILTNSNTCARMLAADPPNVVGARETVRRTIRDANRASEVIKRLRAMYAKKAPTLETLDLNEAAQEVIALTSAELRRSRSILQTDFAEALPAVNGDRVQLQQVILNLLLNAADAMSGIEDRPRTLRVQTQIQNGDSIKLLVQDSGVGLDPSGIEKLFEAFYTTKAHGLGIGLAISRSIIESHKGKLWAMPNDGPGATFGFSIPYASGAMT